jgi:hypothetical protein
MPKVTFTKENLLERTQLTAGWRKLKVKSVDEGPGKSDPTSTVWETVFIVDDGKDLGVPIRHWFSEKQMGRVAEFLRCFTGGQIEEGKVYEMNDAVGRAVDGYCRYHPDQKWNVIDDFRPSQKGA